MVLVETPQGDSLQEQKRRGKLLLSIERRSKREKRSDERPEGAGKRNSRHSQESDKKVSR